MDLSAAKNSRFPFIPGTKPSIKNSQLLISTGIPSLDHIIGGGLPIGSLLVIEEDRFGTYAKVMTKYFAAEGVVTEQPVLIASKDAKTARFVTEMPAVITDTKSNSQMHHLDEQMKIAWRYQNMKAVDSSPGEGQSFGHFYDLTKKMERETIEKADITQWNDDSCPTKDSTFENSSYSKVLQCIQKTISEGQYSISETPAKRQILRIAIHSLGSRLWFSDTEEKSNQDLLKFLYLFRVLLRYSYAVGVVTVPVDCLDNSSAVVQQVEHLSDVAIRLESFMGSKAENSPLFKDFHGLLHLRKLPALNTIASHNPEARDLVFRLRRKSFVIEVLHLPSEMGDTAQREQDEIVPNVGCGSQSRKNLLDF
ncbi:elongator complex protein 4 [Megalopta genalis]|uniref:elongator complex protein 4 n=1 Tax=Megalopta genalis TaxID=115081 RepID=UPI001442F40E|nr:elongator complex protein 4 [Megalopta genalis]XP_033339953.1 elongator complex protein 4 [Megalopta genalis]